MHHSRNQDLNSIIALDIERNSLEMSWDLLTSLLEVKKHMKTLRLFITHIVVWVNSVEFHFKSSYYLIILLLCLYLFVSFLCGTDFVWSPLHSLFQFFYLTNLTELLPQLSFYRKKLRLPDVICLSQSSLADKVGFCFNCGKNKQTNKKPITKFTNLTIFKCTVQ